MSTPTDALSLDLAATLDGAPVGDRRRTGRRLGFAAAQVALLLALAVAAPWLAPRDPAEQLDPAGGELQPPGSALVAVPLRDGRTLLATSAASAAGGGLDLERAGHAQHVDAADLAGPTARVRFPLGSDRYGRDLLSRLLWGARVSFRVALLAVGLSLTLGIAVGAVAGVATPLVDGVLMRFVDGALAFPRLFLVLALVGLFHGSEALVIVVLGATGWMGTSRLVRGELQALRHRDFALAARAAGASRLRLLARHLLPNALGPVLVDTSLRLGDTILVEAALSFLGLGVQPPTPSWGNMIADGRDLTTLAWWVPVFPGVAIVWAVVAWNLLGDALRDRLDPRHA